MAIVNVRNRRRNSAYDLWLDGMSRNAIAKKLDVPPRTLQNWASDGKWEQHRLAGTRPYDVEGNLRDCDPLSNLHVNRYGKVWGREKTDLEIELECYDRLLTEPAFYTGYPIHYHMERGIQLMFPESYRGQRGYVLSDLSRRRIKAWCDHEFQTWWGSTSVGKTMDSSAIILFHFMSRPHATTVSVCSTSLNMTKRRIFGKIITLVHLYDSVAKEHDRSPFPLKFNRSSCELRYIDQETGVVSEESGIFGIPIVKGKEEDAANRIGGTHNQRVALVMDELQGIELGVLRGWDNLQAGNEHRRFLGMGNPIGRNDSLGVASTPKNGWESINPNMEEWETIKGVCLYFDGLKSPGVLDPIKYPYYLSKKTIEDMRKDPGEDTPRWWTMVRGFMPPEGMKATLITQTLVDTQRLCDKVDWAEEPMRLLALDESFSINGDRCTLVYADVGLSIKRKIVIQFGEPIFIPLKMTEQGEIIEYYIYRKTKEYADQHGIPPDRFGLDITASQIAFAAIFLKEWSGNIFQCQFGGNAGSLPFSENDPRPGYDAYGNRVTELWYNFRRYALYGQIKGLSQGAVKEACDRRLLMDSKKRILIEGKYDIRKRASYSPDIMDGHVIITAMCRERFGLEPGGKSVADIKTPEQVAEEQAVEKEPEMYVNDQTEEVWQDDPMLRMV